MSRNARLTEYWSEPSAEIYDALRSSVQGLSAGDAALRLQDVGPNEIEETQEHSVLRLLWRQFESPLVLILVFGAVISFITKDWIEAAIILIVVVSSTLLGFVQEYRASTAVASLRQRLALTVQVWRDGRVQTTQARALVPGDVVELAAGNLVPADGVILEANDFLVTEASLTGESFPVEKRTGVVAKNSTLAERTNCVFLGTSVRSGTAKVLVVNTGLKTAFGAIAARLQSQQPDTEFEHGLRQFGYLLLRIMVIMVVFVLVVNQLLGRPVIESMMFAVALAVGLSPELLPAIVSVTLSRGARAMAERGVIVRRLDAIENLGSMTVFCTDKTGTLTKGVIDLDAVADADGKESRDVAQWAYLNAAFETGIENPLDRALVAYGQTAGFSTDGYVKVDEIPYDFLRKRLTIVVSHQQDGAERTLVTKGAFASVVAICTHAVHEGQVIPLEAPVLSRLEQFYEERSTAGFRVLAVATKAVSAKEHYHHNDEMEMTFIGFLLFFDPPKPEVSKTIQALEALGIGIKVITGDNRYVAAHVAKEIDLNPDAMLTGKEIASMRDEALWHHVDQTDLFVEVDPQQKDRVVRALQHRGHAVGYLGDGINDAPALKTADVGISVDQAVDVARESADIILLRPDLDVLRWGVEEGRRTFANTLKYICITTSANFGNMVSMALVTPVLPFLPLAAKQILLNNFLSDIPSIAISSDNVDAELIRRPQRWSLRDVRRFMIVFGLTSTVFDLITFGVLLKGFDADEQTFQSAWFVVSLLTELLVVLLLRTRMFALSSRPSALLLMSTIVVLLIAVVLPYIPLAARIFSFVPLDTTLLIASLLIVLGYAVSTELMKRVMFRSHD